MSDELRDRLVGIGEAQLAADPAPIRFTGNGPADQLLNDLAGHSHAFVLACLMDRQVTAERAWLVLWVVRQAIGSFEMSALVGLTDGDWLGIM